MYTLNTISDYSNSHVGFYVLVVIFGLISLVAINEISKDGFTIGPIIWLIFTIIFLGIAHNDSYTPYHPENIKVNASFVRFESEGFRQKEGKKEVEYHKQYVVYYINGIGYITFTASEMVVYPKDIILYYNSK
jgi:hypothetical protein